MMDATVWPWLGFNLFVIALLAIDLGALHRKEREIKVGEALWLSLFYIALALIFAAGLFHVRGEQAGVEFLTGYLIEKSLSIDNIFVIVLAFAYFAVPTQYQHRVLFWGILGAVAMRGILIFAGVRLIDAFSWIALVFGAFLIITGAKMLLVANAKPDIDNNVVIKFLRRRIRVTEGYEGRKFFVRRAGLLHATPLFLVVVMIEFTDLVFAVDSIPAIIAVSRDPFIIYTANVFAILGLRALYFALAGIIPRFVYLKYALSLILVVAGGKMIANYFYGGKFVPTELALVVTAALIGGSVVLSLLRTRGARPAAPVALPTGWVPGSPSERPVEGAGEHRAR
jgi:tellurite resistance protein TerC